MIGGDRPHVGEQAVSCAHLFPRPLPEVFEQIADAVHGEGQQVERDEQAGQQGNRVNGSCGDDACEEVVIPGRDLSAQA